MAADGIGLSVCLAAVGNADYQHFQNVILQGVDHAPIAYAKPIARLASQGLDVWRGAGIGGDFSK